MDKRFTLAETKGINPKAREITAWASRAVIDRDNELILGEAWQKPDSTKNFEMNPVLMPFHSYHDLPLGKVTRLDKSKDGLKFTAKFASTEAGKETFSFIEETGLASFSVGFIPRSSHEVKVEKLESAGFDVSTVPAGGNVRVYDHVELLEISLAPIPSNPQAITALSKAWRDGKVKTKELVQAMNNWEITLEPDIPKQAIPVSQIELAISGAIERALGGEKSARIIADSVKRTTSDLRARLGVEEEAKEAEVNISKAELSKKIDAAMVKVFKEKFTPENLKKEIRQAVEISIKKLRGIVE